LITRETVIGETPDSRATSRIVTFGDLDAISPGISTTICGK
jgi:hypothetical protein